ncbi:MAG: hypothetical protein EOM03_13900 [Clostridia bacterium]|nr:hypothetical protein [Clostridia bacterium]
MERKRKLTAKQKKAKESGVFSSVAPEGTVTDPAKFTPEQKEACTEARVSRGFVSNKETLLTLVSQDCLLSDVDTVLGDVPSVGETGVPSVAYITAVDGRLKFACTDKMYSDEETAAFQRGYKMGVEAAISELKKSVGDAALLNYAKSARKVAHMLLQTHAQRINFMEEMTPDELASRIAFYFDECAKKHRSFTVPGLAYEVGFMCRQDLLTFIRENQETLMGFMLARALMKIEDQRNTEIISGGGVMAGHKLDLATNFDWTDAGKRGESSGGQTTNNTTINQTNNTLAVTPDSLPPILSLDQWQTQFLSNEKKKVAEKGAEAVVDVINGAVEKVKKKPGRPLKCLAKG